MNFLAGEENARARAKMIKSVLILMFSATLLFIILALNGLKTYGTIGADIQPVSTITVSGEGEVVATATLATFSYTVKNEADKVADAQAEVTKTIDATLVALGEQGIEEKDIKTTNYSIAPRYSYPQIQCFRAPCVQPDRVLEGYTVSQSISVKVRDVDNAGVVLGSLGEIGVDNVGGLNFTIDEDDALKNEAREIAIKDARKEAKQLAQDLGVRLGRVVNFSEGGRGFYAKYAVAEMAMDGAIGGALSSPKVPVGENTITANVSITYEIK
ncbi:hypothetical protein COB55_00395 [Candidatus Wolfebacteria bacterium]|nr:MAG: hypothetical protein COB55_00395 [Candidatus Wolfebacteria bacterium]